MGKIIESYKEEYMKTQALFRDDVYVEETYCKEKLQWESYYLIKGDKAICANEPIITLAELLYDKLVEATLIK